MNHNILNKISETYVQNRLKEELDKLYVCLLIRDNDLIANWLDEDNEEFIPKMVGFKNERDLFITIFYNYMDYLLGDFFYEEIKDPIIRKYLDIEFIGPHLDSYIAYDSFYFVRKWEDCEKLKLEWSKDQEYIDNKIFKHMKKQRFMCESGYYFNFGPIEIKVAKLS